LPHQLTLPLLLAPALPLAQGELVGIRLDLLL
jgi:hypothetical protein